MVFNQIYDPTKLYNENFKLKIKEEAENFFENYIKESNINVEEHLSTVKKYEQKLIEVKNLQNQVRKHNGIKGLFIGLVIVLTIFRIIIFIALINRIRSNEIETSFIIFFSISYVLTLGITIFLIIYLSTKNRKKISKYKSGVDHESKIASKLLQECNNQMEPLLSLFDYNDPDEILQKVTPVIQVDKSLDIKKIAYLHENFNFQLENTNNNSSTIYSKSGSIEGNPFVVLKKLNHYMSSKTYTGTRIVSYTRTYRDSEGRLRTRVVTETLFATVVKPYPAYFTSETLYFGSPSAPKLIFSRNPFYHKKIEGKEYDKFINSEMKKILKANKKNSSYQELNNDEFEVLFHCDNRNDEIEFRLLFTPLGQQSMVNLIKNSPYGDDIKFYKNKTMNEISTSHALTSDRSCDVKNYYSYSLEKSKEQFVNYCCDYFKSFFFEVAPILSIPLYQQTKPKDFEFKKEKYLYNYSRYDHEVAANELNTSDVNIGATSTIRKTKYVESFKNWDIIEITSYGYKIVKRVDQIPRVAGNGRVYLVPVFWDEYIPIEKTSQAIFKKDEDKLKDKKEKYYSDSYMSNIKRLNQNHSFKIAKEKIIMALNRYNKDELICLEDNN